MKAGKKSLILGIVIVLLVASSIAFWFISRKRDKENNELATSVYSYMGNNDLDMCKGLVTYDESLVTQDTLGDDIKICMAYSLVDQSSSTTIKIDKKKKNNICKIGKDITFATDNYEEDICTVTKMDAKKINMQYEKMYGKSISDYKTFQLDNTTICYYEDGFYYCGLSESYTYTVGAEPHTYRSIKKVTKKSNELVIYDYFLKIINDECYTSYVGNTKNSKCSKNYSSDKEITYKFLKKNATLYKHTFKKNENGYYWQESKPVK